MDFNELLRSRHWTSPKLAKALGVNVSTIFRWRHGICTPNPVTIIEIAKLLEVSEKEVLESFVTIK